VHPDSSGAQHNRLTQAVGLDYGPAFQTLDEIWVEDGSAYATFRIPECLEAELAQVHVHPALLDCSFQLIIQLLKGDYLAQTGTVYVPARIDALHYRPGLSRPHAVRATLGHCSPHSITASFTLYDCAGEAIAWIPQARFNSVRLRLAPADRLRYLDYHAVPKPHPLSPACAPRHLFEDIRKALIDAVQRETGRAAFRRYAAEIEPLLDGLCARFAARALQALAADGKLLTEADVQACADANPATAPLLMRLIGFLEEDRAIEFNENAWHFLPSDDLPSPEDIWNSLIADYPDYFPVFHAVGCMGMHLAQLLQGHRTLEQILPRDRTLGRLTTQMLIDAGLHAIQEALRGLVSDTLAQQPAGRRLRILEIAAGEPLFAAQACLGVDFNRCDYTLLAVDSSIPDEYSRLQEQFPNMEVGLLDPDSGPAAEAVVAGERFQLALVTGDFHTERDALFALAHVKRVLAGRGSMLVVQQSPSRWMDLVLGGRRAWWSEGADGTWMSRHRPARYWRRELQKLGFLNDVALRLSPDYATGPYLLLAQQENAAEILPPPPAPVVRKWVVLADKEGNSARLGAQLRRRLEARGDRVALITPASRFSSISGDHYALNPSDPAQYEVLCPCSIRPLAG
jgi:phthiocerol/phenolphthiocerol synthesis type-I polyketide synthase C